MNKKIKIIFIISLIFFVAGTLNAWTGPTQAPPNGNTDEPLNVSNQTQKKYGNLYFPKWFDGNNDGYYVDPDANSWLYRLYSYDIRSSIFYDRDNIDYYVDPASVSKFNNVEVLGYLIFGGSDINKEGSVRWNSITKTLQVYNGTEWVDISLNTPSAPVVPVDLCAGVSCNPYCSGSTRYYNGSCSGGSCSYASQVCAYGCTSGVCNSAPVVPVDLCAGVSCNPYCSGSTRYYNGSCSGGSCSYTSQVCAYGCTSGVCNSAPVVPVDLCAGVDCPDEIVSYCSIGDVWELTMDRYCYLGSCIYYPGYSNAHLVQDCGSATCLELSTKEAICDIPVDLCLGVSCSNKIISYCSMGDVWELTLNYSCSNGLCSYTNYSDYHLVQDCGTGICSELSTEEAVCTP
ncbi:hypothetical protein KKH36_02215 [Patescibacteria group bacterium]|nr:hypothetical protein [Patescibacteria group bacterium]